MAESENKKPIVLLVDDEENILKSLKRAFAFENFKVVIAVGASAALEELKNISADIVISDFKMPNIDGLKFLEEVRTLYPGAYRIILSGYVDQMVILEGLSVGTAFDFFAKPWDDEALVQRVNRILEIRKKLCNKYSIKFYDLISRYPISNKLKDDIVKAIDENKDFSDITKLISLSPLFSIVILRTVNLVISREEKIVLLSEAVESLGLEVIKSILLVCDDSENFSEDIIALLKYSSINYQLFAEFYNIKYGDDIPREKLFSVFIDLHIKKILKRYFSDFNVEDLSYSEIKINYDMLIDLWRFAFVNIDELKIDDTVINNVVESIDLAESVYDNVLMLAEDISTLDLKGRDQASVEGILAKVIESTNKYL